MTLAESLHGLPDGHPARLVVVEVGQGGGAILANLPCVQELPGNLGAEQVSSVANGRKLKLITH